MDDYQLLIDKALKLISLRPRSKKEITGKLQFLGIKKGTPPKILEKVIQDLEDRGLINDREFILWWKEQRDTFRPKGTRLLKMELRNKGIDSRLIDEVLEESENIQSHEFELALSLAQKRASKIDYFPIKQQKEKIAGLLSRRGFSWEIIYKVIDTVLKKD